MVVPHCSHQTKHVRRTSGLIIRISHCLLHLFLPLPRAHVLAAQDVKISAQEIVDNLHFPNGTAMIPPGAMVYISTDDPDGLCKNCLVNRLPCNTYKTPKPPGCPEDVSVVFVDVCTIVA